MEEKRKNLVKRKREQKGENLEKREGGPKEKGVENPPKEKGGENPPKEDVINIIIFYFQNAFLGLQNVF